MEVAILAAIVFVRLAFDAGRAYQWTREAKRAMDARSR
jgi:hypothetical protein